jgi:predicted PurR-regulated permease PerM|tara:strand:+ start:29867 stop:30919 length:1053 start_codon:yes stop_codon:yes gene_type:complete
MNNNHKEWISITLTVSVLFFTLFIIHRFIPSLVWAGIITIATYPMYRRWRRLFGNYHNVSAFLFTTVLALFFVIPLSWLISVLVKELQVFLNYLQILNRHGGEVPDFIQNIPFFGKDVVSYWDKNLSEPGHIKHLITNLHGSLTPASHYVRRISLNVAHRGFQISFTLLILFFFFRDGEHMIKTINQVGGNCLGGRWYHYAHKLPKALRSTVNGTILVGVGVGILMGFCYAWVGAPGPTLLGFLTGASAMIPFLVPIVFAVVAGILWAHGGALGALIVIVWGTLVMFTADHFVKPVLIGGAIQLPFLAVLFGILGGVETLGLLGLFVGPIIMVLFITLWQESEDDKPASV